jgi:NAD(P)-dependent dehydrogenase (short-subunit alcohol dehydrogenase family)
MQFENKVVIVTGAGTGIGQAVAIGFVNEGAKVAFVGRRVAMLEEAAAGLPAEQVLLLPCDVADRAGVNEAVDQVRAEFGPVDILVNNAGTNTNPRSVSEVKPEDWDLTIAVNLTGAFNFARAVLPDMRAKKAGLIINVASMAGKRAGKVPGAAYSASKHGMVSLTYSIIEEEAQYGVRACVICPGEVNTPILDLRPVKVSDERKAQVLQPEDVAAAALFVAKLPQRASVPELLIRPTF